MFASKHPVFDTFPSISTNHDVNKTITSAKKTNTPKDSINTPIIQKTRTTVGYVVEILRLSYPDF